MGYSIRALPLASALLGAAILLSGCQGGGAGNPTPLPATSQSFPLALRLTTDRASYARSEVVHATLTITNVGAQPATFQQRVDATVSRNGQVVWQYSKSGIGYGLGFGDATLAPGQSDPITVDWDQRDQQEVYAAPGQYILKLWLDAGASEGSLLAPQPYQNTLAAPPVTITIQDMPVPEVPSSPTLTAAKQNGINLLSWTAVGGAAGYHIYRSFGIGTGADLIGTAPAGRLTFGDSNLQPGNLYYYTVRAFNIAGIEGPDSNQVSLQS